MNNSKTKVKIGIYVCALLMMGAIAVASNIANIISAFPEVAPSTIVAYLISVPCLIVIPITIITGKLMDKYAKKSLMIIGVLFWLVGGVVPYFLANLTAILIFRCIFGVGLGMVQTLCAALVVENFEDPAEMDKTMGTMTAFQMLGTIIFSLVAGVLGGIGWNIAFLVHLIAVVSLIGAVVFLPYKKPETVEKGGEKAKFVPTTSMWIWVVAFLVFMVGCQTYANSASSIITEMGLGSSAEAGYSLAIFAVGGLIMGFIFGKVAEILKSATLSVACIVMACAFAIIIFASNLILSYVGAFLVGFSLSVCMPCLMNGAASSVSRESSGMAVSLATCSQNIGMAIWPYVVSPLGVVVVGGSAFTTNQGAFFVGIIVLVTLAVVFFALNRKNR